MKLMPSSSARCRTFLAAARSRGGPQMSGPPVVARIAPNPMRLTTRSPSRSVPAAAAGWVFLFMFPCFDLLRLRHRPQIRLVRLEALRVFFLRVLVGNRGRDDHVLARLPVDRRRDVVLRVQLQRVEQA